MQRGWACKRIKDTTYRVPLLDSKLVRLRYAWYYRIKSPSGPSSALTTLGTPQPSFETLNAVGPRLTYPNLYIVRANFVRANFVRANFVRANFVLITRKEGGA